MSIMVREFKIFTNSKGGLNSWQNVKLYWGLDQAQEGLMVLSFLIF